MISSQNCSAVTNEGLSNHIVQKSAFRQSLISTFRFDSLPARATVQLPSDALSAAVQAALTAERDSTARLGDKVVQLRSAHDRQQMQLAELVQEMGQLREEVNILKTAVVRGDDGEGRGEGGGGERGREEGVGGGDEVTQRRKRQLKKEVCFVRFE